MKKRKKITPFDIVVHIISGFLLLIVLYPLIVVVSSSISDPALVATGKVVLLPKGINLEGYKAVFSDKDIMIGYANTILYGVWYDYQSACYSSGRLCIDKEKALWTQFLYDLVYDYHVFFRRINSNVPFG